MLLFFISTLQVSCIYSVASAFGFHGILVYRNLCVSVSVCDTCEFSLVFFSFFDCFGIYQYGFYSFIFYLENWIVSSKDRRGVDMHGRKCRHTGATGQRKFIQNMSREKVYFWNKEIKEETISEWLVKNIKINRDFEILSLLLIVSYKSGFIHSIIIKSITSHNRDIWISMLIITLVTIPRKFNQSRYPIITR